MRPLRLAALLLLVFASTSPVRAHDVFRFVGTVTKWDAKKQAIDVRTRETWDGKTDEYMRHIVLREECRVMRLSAEVPRSELKPGLYVIVDAAGVDITDLEGTEIEIVVMPPAKKKR